MPFQMSTQTWSVERIYFETFTAQKYAGDNSDV